jgi:hypothetical protein
MSPVFHQHYFHFAWATHSGGYGVLTLRRDELVKGLALHLH